MHLREHFLLTGSEKETNFKDQRVSKKLEKHKVAKKKEEKKPAHRTHSKPVSLSSLVDRLRGTASLSQM